MVIFLSIKMEQYESPWVSSPGDDKDVSELRRRDRFVIVTE